MRTLQIVTITMGLGYGKKSLLEKWFLSSGPSMFSTCSLQMEKA